MLEGASSTLGAFSVGLQTRRIYFLRDDGTAHTMISWIRGAQRRWYPSSGLVCPDSRDWADGMPVTSVGLRGQQ
jgi:hypothetical protein